MLVGSVSIDRIMNFRGKYRDLIAPEKLHVISVSILIDSLVHTRGGVAANIAYGLSLLGDTSVLLASVGTDGQEYIHTLASKGIDTSHIQMSDLPTSTFTVMTDIEDNQVGGFYPGAMSDSAGLSLETWKGTDTIVVVSAYDPSAMQRLVQETRRYNLRLVYDIGQQVSNVPEKDLIEGIEAADVLILNDYELGVLAKRSGRTESEIKRTVPLVVTTLGAKGSIIEGSRIAQTVTVNTVSGITVLDPTGAGDAFRSGFLYGYRRSWDPVLCAQLGSVTASYALEKHGTQEHVFTVDQLKKRYYSTYGGQLPI